MKLIIEFPIIVLNAYNGASNLDETLDDNITYLIGKNCYDNQIEFKIVNFDFVPPVPNVNDELFRYQVELRVNEKDFKPDWMLKDLETEGFEKGLTIKSENGTILYADEYTADIPFRRELRNKKQSKSIPK